LAQPNYNKSGSTLLEGSGPQTRTRKIPIVLPCSIAREARACSCTFVRRARGRASEDRGAALVVESSSLARKGFLESSSAGLNIQPTYLHSKSCPTVMAGPGFQNRTGSTAREARACSARSCHEPRSPVGETNHAPRVLLNQILLRTWSRIELRG
jgi:hypothetical protein